MSADPLKRFEADAMDATAELSRATIQARQQGLDRDGVTRLIHLAEVAAVRLNTLGQAMDYVATHNLKPPAAGAGPQREATPLPAPAAKTDNR